MSGAGGKGPHKAASPVPAGLLPRNFAGLLFDMPTAPPSSPLAFRPELNGLRAVAVGVVVLQHWMHPPFPFGEIGRSLLFILSGYLVSGIIWKYGAYVGAPGAWPRQMLVFFVRRALRIIPPYYLALAGCYLLPLETVQQHLGWFLLPGANLLFYKMRGWGDGCSHYWTLAVDEQFYLLWPFVLSVLGRRMWPLVGLAVAAWAFRLFWLAQVGSGMMHLLLPSNLDLFALGTLLRLGQRQAWLARWRSGWLVLLAWGAWAVGVRVFDGGPWALAWHCSFGTCIAGAAFLTINWLLGSPYAFPFNLTQQPALALPLGSTAHGLPFGLQIVGRKFHDDQVLAFGAQLESSHAS